MASVNKAVIIGYVGHTPRLNYTRSGAGVTRFTVATDWRVQTPDGQVEHKTDWHNCVAFGRTAEVICDYVQKGNQIYVEGQMHTRIYTGKDGTQKTICEIHVDRIHFLRSQEEQGGQGHEAY